MHSGGCQPLNRGLGECLCRVPAGGGEFLTNYLPRRRREIPEQTRAPNAPLAISGTSLDFGRLTQIEHISLRINVLRAVSSAISVWAHTTIFDVMNRERADTMSSRYGLCASAVSVQRAWYVVYIT
jgi:hypothetical protein